MQNLASGAVNLSKFDYTYDDEGQIMSWSSLLGGTTSGRWFEYDNARQLLSARNASDPNSTSQQIDYGYDVGANRTSDRSYNPNGSANNGTLNSYPAQDNALNQLDSFLTAINGSSNTDATPLAYDLAGNLTNDGQTKTFEWDAANRLVAVNYTSNTNRSEFTYDGLSRRVKIVEKTGGTVTSTKKFVWVGNRPAQERDANNGITRSYFAEGEQRGIPGTRGLQNYYYTRDHLGSIREMTNSTGVVQVRYDYDPYGKRTKLSGTLDVDFGYTGHYHHAPSGLNLSLYRPYKPSLGRWLSRDPIGENGGINLYGYVFNDPASWIDPLGLSNDTYVPDNSKHGGPHIDRYNPSGQNVGRYRPDGSGIPHKGELPPPIPNSDEDKFKDAAGRCKKNQVPPWPQNDSPSVKPPSIPWWLAGAAALIYVLELLAN